MRLHPVEEPAKTQAPALGQIRYLFQILRAGQGAGAEAAMLRYYDYSIAEGERFGRVCKPHGAAFGVSVWAVPVNADAAAQRRAAKARVLQEAMGTSCLQFFDAVTGFMSEATGQVTSDRDWYLSILGVSPDFQGQGLGADLITPVLSEADGAGAATYLETFVPRNMSFYARLGYATVGRFAEPVTQSDYWVMRRLPGGG